MFQRKKQKPIDLETINAAKAMCEDTFNFWNESSKKLDDMMSDLLSKLKSGLSEEEREQLKVSFETYKELYHKLYFTCKAIETKNKFVYPTSELNKVNMELITFRGDSEGIKIIKENFVNFDFILKSIIASSKEAKISQTILDMQSFNAVPEKRCNII